VIKSIEEFAPENVESGVGLAIQDQAGRYLFFLAGNRHNCPPGELFYAGIGGHREPGESWTACAQREALEEVGTGVKLLSSPETWYVPVQGPATAAHIHSLPRPLALYEMIHPVGTPRAGELYRLVIFQAELLGEPSEIPLDEVSGVIALKAWQVITGIHCKPTLGELLEEGAEMVSDPLIIDRLTKLYPLGTAAALAYILNHTAGFTGLK
jgi:8-oxo-dGTP pyrophosphatase MutT (NUDIX family)